MSSFFIQPIADRQKPARFAPLKIRQLMPNFGAVVEDIDVTDELSPQIRGLLREAWLTYGVLFFKAQPRLTPDDQLRVASIFGKPDNGSPHVEKATSQVDLITTDEKRPPVTNLWHSDNTTLATPSLGTLIQIQKGPNVGGNTSWACTRKAYECLSPNMKAYLEGLTAVHTWNFFGHRQPVYLNKAVDETFFERMRQLPPREHRIAATHPVTGEKTIYVNETYTTYIKDLHRYESEAILNFLYSWIRMPEFYLTHQWQENDIAVWDNYSMQHYGLADYTEERVNQRVTFIAP